MDRVWRAYFVTRQQNAELESGGERSIPEPLPDSILLEKWQTRGQGGKHSA